MNSSTPDPAAVPDLASPRLLLGDIMSAQVLTVGNETGACDALNRMETQRISCLVVVDDARRPMGIVTERDAVRSFAVYGTELGQRPIEAIMSTPVLTATPDLDYRDAYQLIAAKGYRHLVVVDTSGALAGIVSEGDFLHHLGFDYLVELKTVGSAMSREVLVLPVATFVKDAVRIMMERHFSCVLVGDDPLYPQGILTERDVVHLTQGGTEVVATPLSAVMHGPLKTVRANLPLQKAARAMEQTGIRRLVVVDEEGALAGLITRHDIVKALQGGYIEYLHETIARQQRRLREAETRLGEVSHHTLFHGLMDQVGDGIMILAAADGQVLEANRHAASQLGYGQDGLLALRLTDLTPELPDHYTWARWLEVLRGGEGHLFETAYRRGDGTLLLAEVSARYVETAEAAFVVTLVRDVSERKAAEQARERERALLRALVRSIPDLVWLKDPDGVYLACNLRFERFFGAAEAQILGRTDYDFLPAEAADLFRDHDRQAMAAGHPVVNEEDVSFADVGHREHLETVKTPMYGPAGDLIGVLGIGRDISDRRHMEELQRYGAFQAGIAEMGVSVLHNIGNAITAVTSDAEILRRASQDLARVAELLGRSADANLARQDTATGPDAAPDAEIEHLRAVQREASTVIARLHRDTLEQRSRRILEAVQHIADIVRIQQTAALPSAPATTFDLAKVVNDALAMQGDTLARWGIATRVAIDPAVGPITLSRNRLLQALLNLIKNAQEAIRERGEGAEPGQVAIEATPLGADRFRLAIRDNGVGVTEEQRPHLFRFGYSTKARGTGFGLHATAVFVQDLGGQVVLESPGPGQGVTLNLDLPRNANQIPSQGREADPARETP